MIFKVYFHLRWYDHATWITHFLNSQDRNGIHYTVILLPGLHFFRSWRNPSPCPYQRLTEGRAPWLLSILIRICCWQLSASTSFSSQPRLNGVCNPPSHSLFSLPGVGMLAPVLCHLSESVLLSLAYMDKSAFWHVTPAAKNSPSSHSKPGPETMSSTKRNMKDSWSHNPWNYFQETLVETIRSTPSLAVHTVTARRWAHLWIISLFPKSSRPWTTWRSNSSVPSAWRCSRSLWSFFPVSITCVGNVPVISSR